MEERGWDMSDSVSLEAETWWDRSCFRSNETPDNHCPEVIDITGRRRILVFGPWRRLASGLWRATVSVELCNEASRRSFGVQFGSLRQFTTVGVPRGVAGRHDVELIHRLTPEEHAEIRIGVMAPAFHGSLRFLGAKVEPVAG